MRKRSTEILEKLILSNSKSMEVKKLITTYRISLKTLRTDVNEINDFLLEAKMSPTKLNEKEKRMASCKIYLVCFLLHLWWYWEEFLLCIS